MADYSSLEQTRLDKIAALRAEGIETYPTRAKRTHTSVEAIAAFESAEESEEEFQTLLDFLEEMRFDRVGAFQFSYEEGTASAAFGDTVPAEEKESRYERLMTLQQDISLEIDRSYVGKTLEVLIEGVSEEVSIGRSYRDAPEIDGLIFIYGKANVGDIVPVKITDAMPYDLAGILQS